MEIWDVYDRERNLLAGHHVRGTPFCSGEYHLITHLWIRRTNGDFLVTKRRDGRKYPLLWDCICGSVLANECSYDCAIREAEEEIGIKLDKLSGRCIYAFSLPEYHRHYDVWLIGADFLEKDMVFQLEEITDAKWASYADIVDMHACCILVPTLAYFEHLFAP